MNHLKNKIMKLKLANFLKEKESITIDTLTDRSFLGKKLKPTKRTFIANKEHSKGCWNWVELPNKTVSDRLSVQLDAWFKFENARNWKQDIKLEPTYEDFNNAWRTIFEYNFNECTVLGAGSGINTGFTVETPEGTGVHGGFGYHTESPRLKDQDEIYYKGGCPWSSDLDGVRYHKLDRDTNIPVRFEEACAIEVIRRYIANNQNISSRAIEGQKTLIDPDH